MDQAQTNMYAQAAISAQQAGNQMVQQGLTQASGQAMDLGYKSSEMLADGGGHKYTGWWTGNQP